MAIFTSDRSWRDLVIGGPHPWGCKCYTCGDGREAIRKAGEELAAALRKRMEEYNAPRDEQPETD